MRPPPSPLLLGLLLACSAGDDPSPAGVKRATVGPAERVVEPVRDTRPTPLVAVDAEGNARLPWIYVGDPLPEGTPVRVLTEGPAWVGLTAGRAPGEATWVAGPLRTEAENTVLLTLAGLPAGETVYVDAWVVPATGAAAVTPPETPPEDAAHAGARFEVAPDPGAAVGLKLVVAGDLGGQGHCRPQDGGYAIFDGLAALGPELFVANGDMIYADGACTEQSPAGVVTRPREAPAITAVDWEDAPALRAAFNDQWRYNLADPALRRLYSRTAVVAQWDDHEVVNDFGASWDRWLTGDPQRPGYGTLVAEGRQAFLANSALPVQAEDPDRIYRRLRWGKHAELFVVDARSYRSPNGLPDSEEVGKRMLGDPQRLWLKDALVSSDATWKIVSMDVPLSTPTGSAAWRNGRDGWANGEGDPSTPEGEADRSAETGYERVLHGFLWQLDQANVHNVVFVTTDVHHSRTIRYAPDLDGDGDELVFYELISGPLSAWMGEPGPLDPSFGPQSLFAHSGSPTASWIEVEPMGEGAVLKAALVGADGEVLAGSSLVFPPEGLVTEGLGAPLSP